MPITLTVPQFRQNGMSMRDAIISVLSHKWPLNAKEIFEQAMREYGLGTSYQAAYKTLAQLEAENILVRKGRQFELSRNWISETGNFFSNLGKNYDGSANGHKIDPNFEGTIKLNFDDYTAFAVTMADVFARQLVVGNRPSPGFGIIRHGWFSLRFNFMDFTLLRKMMDNNGGGYALIIGDTPLDRWVAKQYLAAGFIGVKTGVKHTEFENDLVVHGDSILEVKYSEETKKELDAIYASSKNLGGLFGHYVSNTLGRNKHDIEVTITKKPDFAKMLEDMMIEKYFKGAK